jgi:putative PIG3 family NAD(P)H quinone oxidoreductase
MTAGFMPAILVKETAAKGEWNALALAHVPRPSISSKQVLVQVEACSVNRADLLQRRGLYPPPPGAPEILGLDFAGFVTIAGSEVAEWRTGDRVFGITTGGGYGRYLAVPAEHLITIPDNLSFVEAAAVAEVFFTAYLNIFLEAETRTGENLLVHGGGGGVGTAAIQLARIAGIQTIITAGSEETIKQCIELGASCGINYNEQEFARRTMEFTDGKGVDVILDFIGAPYLSRHLQILKTGGRLIMIGLMGGNRAEIELGILLTKRVRIIGSVLRSRSNDEKAALTQSFKQKVAPLLAAGKARPVIDRIYPISAAEEAHQYMKNERHFGKIVLTWQGVD